MALYIKPLPNTYNGYLKEVKEMHHHFGLRSMMHTSPRSKILAAALESHKIKRSIFHTTMVLFGESGVGKSATINHLFGTQMAKTSNKTSETRSATEYLLMKNDWSSGTKDLSLAIIDTPGLHDSDGIVQDACNLACIERALRGYMPLMANKEQRNGFLKPNVILVVLRATDKRLIGPFSEFNKTLMAIKRLDVVDVKKNNLLVVLTNALSFGKPSNVEAWKTQLQNKQMEIKQIVMSALGITTDVVYVENHFNASYIGFDEEDGHDLPVEGDFTILPDGTVQIRNLYEAIARMLTANGDDLALLTINKMFEQRYNEKVFERNLCSARIVAEDGNCDAFESLMLEFIQSCNGVKGRNASESDKPSEITIRIKSWIAESIENGSIDRTKRTDAETLSTIISSQFQMTKPSELLNHSIGTLKQLMQKPDNLTPLHCQMLGELFGVKEEKRVLPAVACIGSGYDIFQDSRKDLAIFDFTKDHTTNEFGIQMPKEVSFRPYNRSTQIMEDCMMLEDYIKRRLCDLSVPVDIPINFNIFKLHARAGFTMASNARYSSTESKYSAVYEWKQYELMLTDYEAVRLSPSFEKAVQNLPNSYDINNVEDIRDVQDFFRNWGQYFIVKGYAGGTMTIDVILNTKEQSSERDIHVEAQFQMNSLLGKLMNGQESVERITFDHAKLLLERSRISWQGGDVGMQVPTLANLDSDVFQQWIKSIANNSSFLTTNLGLVPIYELVKDEGKKKALRSAHLALLSGKLFELTPQPERRRRNVFKDLFGARTRKEATDQFPVPEPSGPCSIL